MHVRTTRAWESKTKKRYSLHFFRWGLHAKLRKDDCFRHGIVKLRQSSGLGVAGGKREVWVGWWEARKGKRKQLNGFKLSLTYNKLPPHPNPNQRIPVYPTGDGRRTKRETRREREAQEPQETAEE